MKKISILLLTFLFSLNFLSAEKIVFSANSMTGQAGNTNTTTTLSGNAYIKTDSMEIQADLIELSGENYKYITAQGKISGKNLDSNMTFSCDELKYDRDTKVAELSGGVNLDDIDNNVKAKAELIIYNQERIMKIADEIAVVADGVVTESGPADKIFPQLMSQFDNTCKFR